MRKCFWALAAFVTFTTVDCGAVDIIGKLKGFKPSVVSVSDFKGEMVTSPIHPDDTVFHLQIDSKQPEIMTFFLTYNDVNGEKRQIYSPILVEESRQIEFKVEEKDGFPIITSGDNNQGALLEFTYFLVDNLRNIHPGNEKNLPEKITEKITDLHKMASEGLVNDYLSLWGESTRLSAERMIHMRSDMDPRTKRITMPRHNISPQDLIENKATIYFPEFVNLLSREYAKGSTLTEKITNLQANLPEGTLLDNIKVALISQYVNANKGKIEPEVMIAEIEPFGQNYAEYSGWLAAIKGYKSYLEKGDTAPEDILIAADGREVKLSDFKGEYLFIDFWASWCTYCIKEFPALEKVKEAMSDSGIRFIGISLDEDKDNWKKAMQKYNLEEDQYVVTSQDLAEKLGLSSIPAYMIYDKEGKMLYAKTPRPRQTDELIGLLKGLGE